MSLEGSMRESIERAVLIALQEQREHKRETAERGYLRPAMTDRDVARRVADSLTKDAQC